VAALLTYLGAGPPPAPGGRWGRRPHRGATYGKRHRAPPPLAASRIGPLSPPKPQGICTLHNTHSITNTNDFWPKPSYKWASTRPPPRTATEKHGSTMHTKPTAHAPRGHTLAATAMNCQILEHVCEREETHADSKDVH